MGPICRAQGLQNLADLALALPSRKDLRSLEVRDGSARGNQDGYFCANIAGSQCPSHERASAVL